MSLFWAMVENLAWSKVGVGNDFGVPEARSPEYGSKLKYGRQIQLTVCVPRALPSETKAS